MANGHQVNGTTMPTPINVPVANDNQAKARFVERYRRVTGSMQSAVFVGELHKTLNQIRHPLAAFRKGMGAYVNTVEKRYRMVLTKNGRKRASGYKREVMHRELTQMLTGTYLEWKFGVKPTLMDIKGGLQAYDRIQGRVYDRTEIHAASSWKVITPRAGPINYGNYTLDGVGPFGPRQMGTVDMYVDRWDEGTVRYSGTVGIPIRDYNMDKSSLDDELMLLPNDWLPSLWEWLPFSWAVDYFFNVQNVLDALTTNYGSILWCNKSVRQEAHEVTTSGKIVKDWADTSSLITTFIGANEAPGSVVEKLVASYVRTPVQPSAYFFVPRFDLTLPSAQQALNLASVAFQLASAQVSLKDMSRRLRL